MDKVPEKMETDDYMACLSEKDQKIIRDLVQIFRESSTPVNNQDEPVTTLTRPGKSTVTEKEVVDDSDSSENWDAETVALDESPKRSPGMSKEDLLAILSHSSECCLTSDETDDSTSTVDLNKSTENKKDNGKTEASALSLPITEITAQVSEKSVSLNSLLPEQPTKTSSELDVIPSEVIGSKVVMSLVECPASSRHLSSDIQFFRKQVLQATDSTGPKKTEMKNVSQINLSNPTTSASQTRPDKCFTALMAKRGITVIPSPTLHRKLNNEVSIISTRPVKRPNPTVIPSVSKMLTVDLTKEPESSWESLNPRPQNPTSVNPLVCQVCDKAFFSMTHLSKHMACHRGDATVSKLDYQCEDCNALFSTGTMLHDHRQRYHGEHDVAIPVVDIQQHGIHSKLTALGINSMILLEQLKRPTNDGLFGLPIVPIDVASNPAVCNILGIGASNLLPLGPIKNIPPTTNIKNVP